MVEVVLTGLGKIADYLVAPIGRQFTYLFCFNSNIKELEAKFEEFQATRKGVQMGVDRDQRNVRVIAPNVEAWLKSASEVTTEVEGIIQDKDKVKEGCLNGWCSNLKLHYSLSRKAVKKTPVVVDLRKDGVQYTQSSYSPPPPCLETITNRDFMGFESRRLHMEEIFKALKHDEINLIGVCGMGGVGKTTMVKEVVKRAKEDKHFDEVAMAVVGQEPNLTNVQACIADMLDLKLGDMNSPIIRADLLRKRLVQDNKKVLVILDDIWKEFDLQAMGIPLEGANKNFKMLYTSRVRDLWHDVRTKKEIPLELLSEDEAWQLFREKAGDLVDARDLQPIAEQIVHECGCLPLALVLIGSALSKKSGRNAIKDIWEGMLDRLTCASSTPADNQLSSRLQLSYEYLEDKEAQRLFLLCCLFQEDEDIPIEDLARYGYGLSLFDGISEMVQVRRRIFLIVDDLKSRYLLLQSSKEKCVKVHDVVRDMGISIVSKDKCAIVSHGTVSEWPKTVTHEHCTAISVISEKIKEVPEGLAYPNLEFLMLRCRKLEKIPPNFFKGIGKLKVLELKNFHGILTFQPLKNLTTLAFERFCGKLDNVRVIGDLLNLEILSFRNSDIEELPEEIGGLVNLRLLDLSYTESLNRIPPGIISRLIRLEELYCMNSKFIGWEGEGKEQGVRNANLREFGFLSNLNTLQICIRNDVLIPESPIFSKLKNYRVGVADQDDYFRFDIDDVHFGMDDVDVLFKGLKRILVGRASIPRIDLLARSSDGLLLVGKEVCNDLLGEVLFWDGVDGIQQLKFLAVRRYDNLKCLAHTMNRVHLPTATHTMNRVHLPTAILRSEEKNPTTTAPPTAAFPILQILYLRELPDLREICRGPVPAGSFGELTSIYVEDCGRLGNLFQLRVVGCLTQLKRLSIKSNDMIEEVFRKERQGDVHDITNRIVFPKLEFLKLAKLPSLVGFCRGIDLIDFPQLKEMRIRDMPQFNLLFHNNSNLSSHSEQGFLSLFPHKVSLPNLEVIELTKLENLERLGHGSLSVGSLSKLKEFSVSGCDKLLLMLRDLENLTVESCNLLEVLFELEGADSNEPNPTNLSPLKLVELRDLPKLKYMSKRDPMGFKYIQTLDISDCNSLRHVFAPTVAKSIPQLRNLRIGRCEMLSRIIAGENGLGESSVDEVEFPQLERLELCDLPSLVSFFPNVNTMAKSSDYYHNPVQPQPLFNEKVSLPNLEVIELTKLENLERLGHGSLSKLREFSLSDCGKLLCVFSSQLLPMLRNLKNLTVESCNLLEVVFELEGADSNEPNSMILSPLELVKLRSLPKLNYISKRYPMGFKYIQTLDISDCNSLKHVFAPTMAKSIPLLCNLRIRRCEILSRIVAEENGLGESSMDEVEFPQLESLELCDLPNLVSFFPNLSTTVAKSSDYYHDSVQPQPLFNEKVAIPSLEYLRLIGLKNVRNMFHPFMAGGLVNLQKLFINDCSTLEVVVGKEVEVGGHGRKLDKTLFPQLIELHLGGLPKLKKFFHFTHPLELPRLSKMDIFFCPSMDAFSLGHISAPNLSLPVILWNGDLNNAIQSLQKLSYEDLEDKAKRLFLLCCFFQEDEDIRIEDLARYGYGLSLFDRLNDMAEVRRRVLLIVDDLKSCHLLLQSSNEKCVKVLDVVRDMGISIASKDKCAIVSHGAVSEWPKTVTHENKRYIAISVISETIKELPEGLAYPNLEFLMLRCPELEKLLPNFFEGIGKLKVLELKNFNGTLTFQPLKNLTTLVLKGFRGTLDNVRVIGDLLNLEILNFRGSEIEELPEEIGELVNLRLLDLSDNWFVNRIPPGVISRLVRLEELYCMLSKFSGWEGEGKEQGGRNANLREFESLSNLNTLWIQIRKDELIPESPIFSKLKSYRVAIVDKDDDRGYDMDGIDYDTDDTEVSFKGLKRILVGHASIPMIDLFARSSDGLQLDGSEGCNDLLREVLFWDGVDGIQQLKFLVVCEYDNLKCLADTMNLVHLPSASAPPTAAFPILHILHLTELPNLRDICRGPVPAGSFGELTSIRVEKCGRLGYLFQLPIVGCLTQLKHLSIKSNYMMEEVFRKERQGDVRDITNRIVFPKLEFLKLKELPSLVGFCRGIDLIDFPQLKELHLQDMPQFNLLFHTDSNLSSHSEQGFLSLFPHKV